MLLGGDWYQVGKGAFALSYLGSASKVSVAIPASSGRVAHRRNADVRRAVRGSTDTSVYWSVKEPDGGTINQGGVYTAPATPGTYTVTATSQADVRASTSIRVPWSVIPVGHIPGYDVGVDYHSYGVDFTERVHHQYQDRVVRQDRSDRGSGDRGPGGTVILTRIGSSPSPGRRTSGTRGGRRSP